DAARLRSAPACGSKRPPRLVAPAPRADGEQRHAFRPRDRDTRRLGIEAQERADAERHLLAFAPVDARPTDADVALLLPRLGLVVLEPFGTRWEVDPVDPERRDAQLPAHEVERAAGPAALDLVDVCHREAHGYILKTPKVVSGIGAFSAAAI